ncbi:MAG: DUF4157 domain-containing protein [Gemmatimonadales bacterium]|nr:MAG: DUF4157 domain-containing protein [Gemmatimonadales bacterium]
MARHPVRERGRRGRESSEPRSNGRQVARPAHACAHARAPMGPFGSAAIGNRTRRRLASGEVFQPRLRIGAVGDPLEREADSIAERVVRMPAPGASPTLRPDGCDRGRGSAPFPASAGMAASIVRVRRGGGTSLPPSVRSFFEPRFGQDFAEVRIHTGADAAASAAELTARAYTVGRDIVFGRGEFAPGSVAGRLLLAHELAHVVQQGNAPHGEGSTVRRTVYNHDPDWARRVAAAAGDQDRIALLNEAAEGDRRAYPSLLFPITPLPSEERERLAFGVYYDPDQSDPGLLHARPRFFRRRIPFTDVVISRRSEPAPANPDVPGEPRTGFYVTLGPGALSEHNAAHTQRVLYHEHVHVRQRTGRQDRDLLDPLGGNRDRQFVYGAAKEALAHARDFARYFRHLHVDESDPWDREDRGRRPHDALYSLIAIEHEYWPSLLVTGGERVRERVVRILASAPANDEERARALTLARHLSGTNRVGQRTEFRRLLIEALESDAALLLGP